MKKKKNGTVNITPGRSVKDNILLALAFVGEHPKEFKEWIESKGGKVVEDSESEDVL